MRYGRSEQIAAADSSSSRVNYRKLVCVGRRARAPAPAMSSGKEPATSSSSSSSSSSSPSLSSTKITSNAPSIPKPSGKDGNPVFRMMGTFLENGTPPLTSLTIYELLKTFLSGLPNFRFRLPSRNWLIFLSVATCLTSTILYDRRERQRATRKWAEAVAHVAAEPLTPDRMPRRVTVYVASPPGDGASVRAGRELFHEYVRPVLMAAGMDWDVVEGRREGDVRSSLAGRVRRFRRKRGESSGVGNGAGDGIGSKGEEVVGEQEVDDGEEELRLLRERIGIKEWEGVGGDIVLGRHTWKEYVRGLHEGWLGPLKAPKRKIDEEIGPTTTEMTTATSMSNDNVSPTSSSSPETSSPTSAESSSLENSPQPESQTQSKPQKPQRQQPPTPHIYPSAYSTSPLPPTIPTDLGPSTALPFPHLLGFLNTPIRLKRFLMRRKLADEVGREVAGVVLGRYDEFERTDGSESSSGSSRNGSAGVAGVAGLEDDASPVAVSRASELEPDLERRTVATAANAAPATPVTSSAMTTKQWQQARLLEREEADWPSSIRGAKHKRAENGSSSTNDVEEESVWTDAMVLDDRIAGRMRRFVFEGDGKK